jgi:CHAT domain-containing protein
LAIRWFTLAGVADAHLGRFPESNQSLTRADALCNPLVPSECGDVIRAWGVLALDQGDIERARSFFQRSLSFARVHQDRFLESTALLNLGVASLQQEHFDESIDWSMAAHQSSAALGFQDIELVASGNLGLAYYRIGDAEKALNLFVDAEKRAEQLGDVVDQVAWLIYAGYVYTDDRDYSRAEQIYSQALSLAQGIDSKQDIFEALRALARVSLKAENFERAEKYANQAFVAANQSENRRDQIYPRLMQGQVLANRGDVRDAQNVFQEVAADKATTVFLKWEAERSLARLFADQNQTASADHEYRVALTTFEGARQSVQHEDAQLSFLTNAASIYDDYLRFLITHGRSNEALRWADYYRARTLTEGLGLLGNGQGKGASAGPPTLNAQEVLRKTKGAALFYWLGEKQSYLWVITPRKTSLFSLPAKSEIEGAAQRYRKALADPGDVLDSANEDGQWLYRTLVAPAMPLLGKAAKAFIIPDGSLNNVNFETFIVSEPVSGSATAPKLHFWIEDATVTSASSLRMLDAANVARRKHNRKLLLIGDSVAPSKEYPELPKAALQMDGVARHFAGTQREIFSRAKATPTAYLASHPEEFSHIHFVAHGTASRLSPLDSAIVLSTSGGEDDFKLHAREILHHKLTADLVTISACYSAGERAYSGEGLVGLSWAFLGAGAHNVVAALWDATDAPTEQLMNKFYDELEKGMSPDAALRTAKLSLLHGGNFRNPFYWAPFQLYAGS